jgi:hypothetical protein
MEYPALDSSCGGTQKRGSRRPSLRRGILGGGDPSILAVKHLYDRALKPAMEPTLSIRVAFVLRRQRGSSTHQGEFMGRGILLWLLGVPISVILLLALLWH